MDFNFPQHFKQNNTQSIYISGVEQNFELKLQTFLLENFLSYMLFLFQVIHFILNLNVQSHIIIYKLPQKQYLQFSY
ncbi:unnamed protein product [Paramecium sonneborni]|uniref:Transmembrane protein n=1 Tax=Paramecium sonneborni TaxID=65129 RepID=A0A8S1M8J0_9CILI|nr:unnamed protein product [Paramecium sonneborni]